MVEEAAHPARPCNLQKRGVQQGGWGQRDPSAEANVERFVRGSVTWVPPALRLIPDLEVAGQVNGLARPDQDLPTGQLLLQLAHEHGYVTGNDQLPVL